MRKKPFPARDLSMFALGFSVAVLILKVVKILIALVPTQ